MSHYAQDVELVVHSDAFLESRNFPAAATSRRASGSPTGSRTFDPGYHFDIEEAREVGDAVALGRLSPRRAAGRVAWRSTGRTAYVYRLREGKIVRAAIYPSRDEALVTLA